jgi:microsomal dipeptidase-like Zn-dependent dipeptidase
MQVVSEVEPRTALDAMRRARGKKGFGDKVRAVILRIASMFFSHRHWWSGYRSTIEHMTAGGVRLGLSVLYRPSDELHFGRHYMEPPEAGYFPALIADLEAVEADVGERPRSVIRLVHNRAELDAWSAEPLASRTIALVHAVEGGFHLGDTADEIDRNVAELARLGVAYVTVAHLFFRQVATNAPALPFLKTDRCYDRLFRQPPDVGLTSRGVAVVRALVHHRILVDISHMRPDAIDDTFTLLDEELDPQCRVPVISSHAGYRFGGQSYMHDDATLRQIKRRDGVVGLIMAQYQLNDGIRRRHTKRFDDSFAVICRHIDKIREVTGDFRHIAIGTDFDGFIKPTMGEIEDAGDLKRLEKALRKKYGEENAEAMCSANVLRMLQAIWLAHGPATGQPTGGTS